MSGNDLVTIALAAIAVLLIPAVSLLWRSAVKWTRTEDKLTELTDDMRTLIEQISLQQRVRFLEENLMLRGRDELLATAARKDH